MSTFHERKAQRTEHFRRYVHGWKLQDCTACYGSGRYDSHRSPRCGACDGTGKERVKPQPEPQPPQFLTEPIDDDEFVQMLMDRDMGDS